VTVLSIQSSVALGHVGNSGAAFVLQRLGHEVWPLDTVVLSNHPAHGGFRGRVTPAAEIAELVAGLGDRGVLPRCRAVLTGYLGDAAQGPVALDAVEAVRAANKQAIWALDPVLGDHGRVYVKPGIPEFLRDRAVPQADVLTPNQFELEFLTGMTCGTTEEALAAIDALRSRVARKKALVAATGLSLSKLGPGTVAMIAADATGAWRVTTPVFDHPAWGAGDVFAALLLGRLLSGLRADHALSLAASATFGVVARSAADNRSADLALVAAQNELTTPTRTFPAERLR
jgi:pyridoxine kinase